MYSNGGHNLPVIVKPDHSIELLESTEGTALGVMPDLEYQENAVVLEPDSMIVFYTDGVNEAEKEDGELFGMDRFCEYLQKGTFRNAKDVTKPCSSRSESLQEKKSSVRRYHLSCSAVS